jgi:hypothetical protein
MKQSGFNPHARWDRHIPETSDTPPTGQLDEKIEVLAWFRGGKIQPQAFIWNNKEYKITHITYNWQERRGRELISLFSVSTGADLYQISFNNTSLGWRIEKIVS